MVASIFLPWIELYMPYKSISKFKQSTYRRLTFRSSAGSKYSEDLREGAMLIKDVTLGIGTKPVLGW